jgi:hypothetical protein
MPQLMSLDLHIFADVFSMAIFLMATWAGLRFLSRKYSAQMMRHAAAYVLVGTARLAKHVGEGLLATVIVGTATKLGWLTPIIAYIAAYLGRGGLHF